MLERGKQRLCLDRLAVVVTQQQATGRQRDLEAVLIAPPRREIDRRYSVEEISESPDLRNAVARI